MSELADRLRELPVIDHAPGFWDHLEAQLTAAADQQGNAVTDQQGNAVAEPQLIDPETGRSIPWVLHGVDADLAGSRRWRRWAFAAAAAAAAVLLFVVGTGLLSEDSAPGPVITDPEPDTSETPREPEDTEPPVERETPSTTVPTTTVTTDDGPATTALELAPFAQPAGYGAAVDEARTEPAPEQYEFTLYGPEEPDGPVRGTLLVGSGPINVNPDLNGVLGGFAFDSVVRAPMSFTRAFGLEVVLASTSLSEEQLGAIADGLTIDRGEVRITPPPDVVELSRGRYASRSALINNLNLLRYTYRSERRPAPGWWRADDGRPTGTVYVWASEARPYDLDLVGVFGRDPRQVEVAGQSGIMAGYPFEDGAEMLAYVNDDGILVTAYSSDPSVDLIDFVEAQSAAEPLDPPRALPYSFSDPVLEGTDLGVEWLIYPSVEASTGVVHVCSAWAAADSDDDLAENLSCGVGGFNSGARTSNGFYIDQPIRFDGEAWLLYLGRAPDCAAEIQAWNEVEDVASVGTVVAPDGHRYFSLPVALGEPDISSPEEGWHGGFYLAAYDADGGFLDSTFSSSSWSLHC